MNLTRGWTRAMWRSLTAVALVTGFGAPLVSVAGIAAQESLPGTAAAAPENAVLFHVADLDRDSAQWQQSEELLTRVGVPDALDLWEAAILAEGEASGDFSQADLDALLGGEMAVVVLPAAVELIATMTMEGLDSDTSFRAEDATPTAAGDAPFGVVGILLPGDFDAAWEYVEGQVADLAASRDVAVAESTYGEAEVLMVPAGAETDQSGMDAEIAMDEWMGGHAMDGSGGFVTAAVDGFILVGGTEADVMGSLDVIAGTAGSLADSAAARAVAAELPADALSFTYIDGGGILGALDPEAIAMLQCLLMEVPVEALNSQAGIAISADAPGFRFDTVTILNDAVDLAAITVANDPTVAAAAERAPAGTFFFQAGRIPESSFQGLPFALAQAVNGDDISGGEQATMMFPTEEEMAAEIATAAATLEFNPETDLFDLLGDEFIAFSSFPSIGFEDFGVDAVAAITTTDPDALAETARKTAAWIDRAESSVDIATRSAGEETVYVVTDSEMEGAPGVEFGVVGDQAVIGIGGGVDQLVTTPADALAADSQFQTVMGLLPAEYYQIGYVDIGQAIDPLLMVIGAMGMMDGAEDPDAAVATPVTASGDPGNIRALGAIAYQQDNVMGASAILYIADGG